MVLQLPCAECKVSVHHLLNLRFVWAVLQLLSSECKVCVGCFACLSFECSVSVLQFLSPL